MEKSLSSRANQGFPLSDTSALVLLLLGDDFYESAAAQDYLRGLDLSAGAPLCKTLRDIYPHYPQVIHNRKFVVRNMAQHHVRPQIVIAGAGLDAMGLELSAMLKEAEIFELDHVNMEVKQQMIGRMGDTKKPHCVSADLSHPTQMIAALRNAGWSADTPSLLILEGITYYLTPAQLTNLVTTLSPERIIADFLKPSAELSDEAARIADAAFGAIIKACDLDGITRYSAQTLAQTISREVIDKWSMARIESERPNAVQNFGSAENGWIELAVFK